MITTETKITMYAFYARAQIFYSLLLATTKTPGVDPERLYIRGAELSPEEIAFAISSIGKGIPVSLNFDRAVDAARWMEHFVNIRNDAFLAARRAV